ncbi:MAG TPA: hypothetical protein VMS65_14220 [Polyangiaceae bacterium]|nr:hypothetical protein [Polyangiaceae bacterium]
MRKAVAKRRNKALSIFLAVIALVITAVVILPREYESELRMMIQRSAVLDPDEKANPLAGASDVITRRENIEELVKKLELAKTWDSTRPPALRLKDRVSEAIRGKPTEQDLNDALVAMLENRIWARTEENRIIVGAEWSDPQIAKRIVEAAKESFLESRHTAEISVIEEKMAILEGHATRLRTEIDGIAQELGRLKDEKIAAAEKAARQVTAAAASAPPPAPVRAAAPRRLTPEAVSDTTAAEDLSALKEELETKKRKLADLQARRSQTLLESKGRLVELKLKYTEDHPEVRAAEQRIELLSQDAPEAGTLVAEIGALEGKLRRSAASARLEAATAAGRASGAVPPPSTGTDALPSEILKLLDNSNDLDPAIGAQLSTALSKYTELRSEIRSSRIVLDTAQAAFNYRYKIVVPATTPLKPSKPKVSIILLGGFLVAFGLALLVPVALELKTGVIMERWQVQQIPIPLLGELKLPPRNE